MDWWYILDRLPIENYGKYGNIIKYNVLTP